MNQNNVSIYIKIIVKELRSYVLCISNIATSLDDTLRWKLKVSIIKWDIFVRYKYLLILSVLQKYNASMKFLHVSRLVH